MGSPDGRNRPADRRRTLDHDGRAPPEWRAVRAGPGRSGCRESRGVAEQARIRPVRELRTAASMSDAVTAGLGAMVVGLLILALACTNVSEPPDGACGSPSGGNVGAAGSWRQPDASDAPVADREPAAVCRRRRPQLPFRMVAHGPRCRVQATDAHRARGISDAPAQLSPRHPHLRLHVRSLDIDGAVRRPGLRRPGLETPGDAGDEIGPCDRSAVRSRVQRAQRRHRAADDALGAALDPVRTLRQKLVAGRGHRSRLLAGTGGVASRVYQASGLESPETAGIRATARRSGCAPAWR